ncbi:MAG: hypothetical protein V7655_08390 [Aequorivita antarctica]
MYKLTHIINPVKVSEASDLFVAQPVTFETIRRAKAFAKDIADISLITAQYEEDKNIIPGYFIQTPDLKQSVLDYGSFTKQRKLPLLKDILQRAVDYQSNTDYVIYTNTDIALMPFFYSFINEKIEEGYDAFIINRRTISKKHTLESLYSAYSEFGIEHPGYDCFIFKKELFNKFILEKICVGAKSVGLALYLNLVLYSNKFCEFDIEHLTFHIGNDRIWKNKDFKGYELYNEAEFRKIKSKLENEFNINELNSIIKYTQRYWNKPTIPKWKKKLINLLIKT